MESSQCEGPLTIDECFNALSDMATGKSPGVDGLPPEFFIKFWDLIGPDLVEVINSCYKDGRLAPTQRCGIITLLYKKDAPLDTPNWRLISFTLSL